MTNRLETPLAQSTRRIVDPEALRAVIHLLRVLMALGIALWIVRGHFDAALAFSLVLPVALVAAAARAPAPIELAFVAGLAAFQWAAAVGVAQEVPGLDAVAHFVLALLAVVLLSCGFARHARSRHGRRRRRQLAATWATLSLAVGWELVEYTCDVTLGTNYSLGVGDTIGDLVAGFAGAGIGLVVSTRWLASGDARRRS
jgi:hypothetical protein